MKYGVFFIVLSIIFLIVTSFNQSLSISSEEAIVSRWKIEEWNDEIAVEWGWGGPAFSVITGTYINYTLDTYYPGNFTHPSSGTIEIGNLTTQVTNNETAEVLVLSIWGWFPGLITSSNDWNYQKQVAEEVAQGYFAPQIFEINDISYNFATTSRKAINFTYIQDTSTGGNQNTTLIYDKDSGVLLEGYTEFLFEHYYILHLKLVESDLISSSNITSLDSILIFLIVILGIASKRKNKRKK